jgi:aspartate carbamoyltransferase catalytic subunit
LVQALSFFHPKFHFIAPDLLRMPLGYRDFCVRHNLEYDEQERFDEEAINRTDILYMTRIQRERFSDLREYEQVKNVYCLHKAMLDNAKPNLRVLHPLPRVNEIAYDVDESEKAYYFQQAQNGLYTREAIICRMLNIQL